MFGCFSSNFFSMAVVMSARVWSPHHMTRSSTCSSLEAFPASDGWLEFPVVALPALLLPDPHAETKMAVTRSKLANNIALVFFIYTFPLMLNGLAG
ncbi:hypothetical protein D3C76_174720 [compost metagenome]